jgi:hypothetical protein
VELEGKIALGRLQLAMFGPFDVAEWWSLFETANGVEVAGDDQGRAYHHRNDHVEQELEAEDGPVPAKQPHVEDEQGQQGPTV